MDIKANRLASIDVLRGLAALVVLFYHAKANAWIGYAAWFREFGMDPLSMEFWLGWITTPIRIGFTGVQLLFVISGYCIHRNQAKMLALSDRPGVNWGYYVFRRFFRIYPTYVFALAFNGLILFALIPWLVSQGHYNMHPGSAAEHSWYVFVMNLATMQNILVPPYEGVFWSLSIEVHLYIVYPIIYYISKHFGARSMLLFSFVATVLSIPAKIYIGGQFIAFLSFMPFWFTWCLGAYIAEVEVGRAKPFRLHPVIYAGLGFLGVAIWLVGSFKKIYLLMLIAEPFMGIGMAGVVAWSLLGSKPSFWTNRTAAFIGWVGTFSYTLYAIHVPILQTFTTLWGEKPRGVLASILACIFAIAVAYVMFNLVERWTLTPPKRKQRTFVDSSPEPFTPQIEKPVTLAATSTDSPK